MRKQEAARKCKIRIETVKMGTSKCRGGFEEVREEQRKREENNDYIERIRQAKEKRSQECRFVLFQNNSNERVKLLLGYRYRQID